MFVNYICRQAGYSLASFPFDFHILWQLEVTPQAEVSLSFLWKDLDFYF